jgi:hypothetical protein
MKKAILMLMLVSNTVFAKKLQLPIDKKATKETIQLYNNLKKLAKKGTMFGHQDGLAYGVNWKYEPNRSDVKDICGDYPAVLGWELGRLEIDQAVNIDSVPFDKMQQFIKQTYQRGGVNTISWHLNNPLTGKSAWDPATGTVKSILKGGEKYEVYKSWLNKVAKFLSELKDDNGVMIPVIFRPFHELNGSWFWWGKNHCTPQEIKTLYQQTVQYLRDEKQLHHLLYAFNTDKFYTSEEYLERYPGDDFTDLIGFDIYQRGNDVTAFVNEFDGMLGRLEQIANIRGKIAAVTEFGYGRVPNDKWFTGALLQALKNHHMSYALAWRNAGKKSETDIEYYVPYTGHPAAADFAAFYKDPFTLFTKEAKKKKLYGKKK